MAAPDEFADAASVRKAILARYACRMHVAVILGVCFMVGLVVTKVLLMVGVHTMWIRYSFALIAAYLMFLLGVHMWLLLTGLDRPMLRPRRRSREADGWDNGFWGGVGSHSDRRVDVFQGGGGRSGGGGATGDFGETSSAPYTGSFRTSSSGSSDGIDMDFGDAGWVAILLIALAATVFGSVVWLIYAAPTILADAAFAGLLAAGLVRSTRRITSGGWISSVVGDTWIPFAAVFVLALAFAIVAQRQFPDAHSLVDVLRRL